MPLSAGTSFHREVCKRIFRSITAPFLIRLPLRYWPCLVGRLHDLSIPRGVEPQRELLPSGAANIKILIELLNRTTDVAGDIAECGVWRGHTLIPMALYLRQIGSNKTVFGFDSFCGFDDAVEADIELGGADETDKRVGGFSDTSFELVMTKVSQFKLSNVRLVAGYFRDSLVHCAERAFSFVHLDCDIYSSYKECLEFFYPRLAPSGIILLDEYNDPPWPGCNRAVDEFLSDKRERLERIAMDNYERFFLVKRA
jgi:O-methyltransferase